MPYEVLLKKAHELVDAAPSEKLEWVVGVLEGEDAAKKFRSEKTLSLEKLFGVASEQDDTKSQSEKPLSLEEAFAFIDSLPHKRQIGKWNREDAYDRGL